jgi:prevent-host-death family protein
MAISTGQMERGMTWTLARAKDCLSEVIRQATDEGPQVISVRGREAAVVLSKAEFDRINPSKPRPDFKAFLLSIPSLEGVDLSRDDRPAPDVEL